MLNLQLWFGARCFSWFFLAKRESIISNSKQWQALVSCPFEGALNLAEGKKTLPIPTTTNMQQSFLLFTGFSCPAHIFTHQVMAWAVVICRSRSLLWRAVVGSAQAQQTAPGHLLSCPCAWSSLWSSRSTPHLQLNIHQGAAAYKALTSACRVNSWLLPTLCSFVGSYFHGSAPIFSISSFSFWGQLFGRDASFLNRMYE